MPIDEVEVYTTPDGFGRAAIVRRYDGLLFVYQHWKLADSALKAIGRDEPEQHWLEDKTPPSLLYENREPETGIFGTVDDARRYLRSLPGFLEAKLG